MTETGIGAALIILALLR